MAALSWTPHNNTLTTVALQPHDDRRPDLAAALDVLWTLHSSVIIFVMQAGFALVEVGSARAKSARDVMLKNVLDASVCLLLWWMIGSAIAGEEGNGLVGGAWQRALELDDTDGILTARWLLGYMYASSSATIISGAIAERTQHLGYIVCAVLVSGLIYPCVAHWLWAANGWLSRSNPDSVLGGAFDFAGSGVVHVTAGTLALLACHMVGPRRGRFDEETGLPLEMRGQSSSFIMLGTFLLWYGWLAFNMGSLVSISTAGAAATAARIASRTMLAGSAGCVAVTALEFRRSNSWSLPTSCYGILAGLVAITGSCATVGAWAAVVIGAVGALLYYASSFVVLNTLRVDDVVDAFAVHTVSGAWGLLAVGIFANGSYSPDVVGILYGGDCRLLGAAAVALVAIALWSTMIGGTVLWLVWRLGYLQISPELQRYGDAIHAMSSVRSRRSSAAALEAAMTSPVRSRVASLEISSNGGDTNPMADASVHGSEERPVRNGVNSAVWGSRSASQTSAARAADV